MEDWIVPKAHKPRTESGLYMYYVYVLKNKNNNFLYKGFTKDLKQRIKEHNSKNSPYTSKGEWGLVYYEAFLSEKIAREEERFLKSGKGRERLKYIIGE